MQLDLQRAQTFSITPILFTECGTLHPVTLIHSRVRNRKKRDRYLFICSIARRPITGVVKLLKQHVIVAAKQYHASRYTQSNVYTVELCLLSYIHISSTICNTHLYILTYISQLNQKTQPPPS